MKNIYLDNGATSFPKPKCVAEAMLHYITEVGANIGRGGYEEATQAEEVVFETRERIQILFNAPDSKNVIFTQNITQSLNMIIKGYLKPGDHILVSAMEHNAVMRPLIQLEKIGVRFDRIPCNIKGQLMIEHIQPMILPETKAILLMHASNVCGSIMPIEQVGEICKRNGLKFIVDAAQTAGVIPIDMKSMNIDILTFTGHKSLMGPQGIGGFVIVDELINEIEPLISGGTGSISNSEEMPTFLPDRYEAGTMNIPGIYGLHASVGYIMQTGLPVIHAKEMLLTQAFMKGLSEIKGVRCIGPGADDERTSVVSIQVDKMDIAELAYRLDSEYGIKTRVGLHCSPNAHKTLNTYPVGTLRFSFGYFNEPEDVDHTLMAIEKVLYGV